MKKVVRYRYNEETLSYEQVFKTRRQIILEAAIAVLCASIIVTGYYFFYTRVLDLELPKTVLLRKKNVRYKAEYEELNRRLDAYEEALDYLRQRDNDTYRLLFGMEDSPAKVKVNKPDSVKDMAGNNMYLQMTKMRLDALIVNSCNQHRSFDEIFRASAQSGDLAAHVPAIPPMIPDQQAYRITSRFGRRTDPVYGYRANHTGVDFAMKLGTPIYSVGDGVVCEVVLETKRKGYGNYIIIDHGFGYKTRYGHLKTILVTQGQKVTRGEQIALSGNSGKSTGPHLHFEVIYRNNFVNPLNYMDLYMDADAYGRMVINKQTGNANLPPANPIHSRRRRTR